VVTFPDVPEAITEGDTLQEARRMAQEALEVSLTFYTENSQPAHAGTVEKGNAHGAGPGSERGQIHALLRVALRGHPQG